MISSWRTLFAPWRIAVPTQSVPVSPPPTTTTSFPAAGDARGGQPVAGVAEGLPPGLRPGGGKGALGRGPAPLLHHHAPLHRQERTGDRDRDRRHRVDPPGGGALRDAGSARDRG